MHRQETAVFLDRDGVLIHDVHYLSKLDQIEFYKDVPNGLKRLKAAGYKLLVITNQSGIARGYFAEPFVQAVHDEMNRKLENYHVQLDGIYFCPHHKDGLPPYNIECDCRKPKIGLINEACNDYPIDLARSVMIGDKLSDIELADNAKIQGILLTTGYGAKQAENVKKRYNTVPILHSFSDAVQWILANQILANDR